MPHEKSSSSTQKRRTSLDSRVYASAVDALDVIRDTAARGYASVGNSRPTSLRVGASNTNTAVAKGTVAVQSSHTVVSSLEQSGRSEDDHDTVVELHEDEVKENNPATVTRGTLRIQHDHDDNSPRDGDNHLLILGSSLPVLPLGKCARLYQIIKRNPRRSFAALIFIIGILVMSVYVDAIVEQRACFFLKPPYKQYKIKATNENACTNLLPLSTYYTPLNTTLINRHPNTVYNVVLFGDSMVDYACLSHNLTGRIISFLPQYATNLRFFNKGIPDTSIAQQRDRLESTIISIYQEVRFLVVGEHSLNPPPCCNITLMTRY